MEKINFEKCLYKISNIYKLKYKIIFFETSKYLFDVLFLPLKY